MKIVEIIPQLHIGGAEHFVVDLCNGLSSEGHDVTLIVTNSLKKYGHFEKYLTDKVSLICMEKREGPDPMLFFRLPRLIRKIKPDIVHTHLGAVMYNVLSPHVYSKAKYVHTIHNTAEKEALAGGRLSVWTRKWQFHNKYSIPVTISDESDRSFTEYYGAECKATMIPNGVSYIAPNPEKAVELHDSKYSESIKIVNVARVMRQKNQIELVKAVEMLNGEGIAIQLFIIGYNDTPEGNEIRSFNPSHTLMLGPKNNPRDYMAAADAFVLSSIYEGMPLTLIESFSVGTVPICTPVGGTINMIEDGINGILTSGTTSNEIAEGLRRFVRSSEYQRNEMKKKALESYTQYSMKQCTQRYLELFKR